MPSNVFMFLAPLPLPPVSANYYREAHPYGPDNAGGFNTDLAIEIDQWHLDYAQALAVVDGSARFIPNQSPDTGTLILKPAFELLTKLSSILGSSGSLVFVYRNLDSESVQKAILSIIKDRGPIPVLSQNTTPENQAKLFINGNFYVSVAAGAVLGNASTTGGTGGWAHLGFEITYIPALGGDSKEDSKEADEAGWKRLKELIDPSNLTRRLDPMAFYAKVASSTDKLTLATEHVGHVLLSLPTRRTLIEIRDEYDRPYTDPVTIQEDGAPSPVPVSVQANLRGTFVVARRPSTGSATTVTYTVMIPNHVLTALPSGPAANSAPSSTMAAPDHWSLQAIFMDDVNNPKNWFVANSTPLPRFTRNNNVTPIRDGVKVFRKFEQAMRTVGGTNRYIYLANWWLDDNFPLVAENTESTVNMLMRGIANRDANVRALLFDQPGTSNNRSYQNINALPGNHGQAILDNEVLNLGSHHQKFMVVNGYKPAFAFCGGVDINRDRRDSEKHGARGGFHDVHAMVEGPAVADIHRSFVDRWNNHPTNNPPRGTRRQLDVTPPPFDQNAGTVFVQVARTYAPQKRYPFSLQGSLTPLDAFIRAIGKAKKFIYIEDQYLTPYPGTEDFSANTAVPTDDSVGVLKALMEALKTIDYLIIVIPNHIDLVDGRFRRRNFIRGLLAADPNAKDPKKRKVHVFYLSREGHSPDKDEVATEGGCSNCSGSEKYPNEIYCHSKVWIVDDICAKIGSANCNRRSYTHDCEMDLIMVDGALDNGARAFARRLRLDLWGEHLNLNGAKKMWLEDHKIALSFWLEPPRGSHITPYLHDENATPGLTYPWDDVDPDGR